MQKVQPQIFINLLYLFIRRCQLGKSTFKDTVAPDDNETPLQRIERIASTVNRSTHWTIYHLFWLARDNIKTLFDVNTAGKCPTWHLLCCLATDRATTRPVFISREGSVYLFQEKATDRSLLARNYYKLVNGSHACPDSCWIRNEISPRRMVCMGSSTNAPIPIYSESRW